MRSWKKSIPGTGNGKCKDREVGMRLTCSRTSRKAGVAGEERENNERCDGSR